MRDGDVQRDTEHRNGQKEAVIRMLAFASLHMPDRPRCCASNPAETRMCSVDDDDVYLRWMMVPAPKINKQLEA